MLLLLIFFMTPIVEMYLLITVAGYIDAWPTIALVMLTAVIGVALLKRQGLATLTRGVSRMNRGEVPAQEMAEGILLAVAGALLLTPGFVTDTVGFVLLFPPARQALVVLLLKRVEIHTSTAHAAPDAPPESRPVIIEGDYEKK
ncbi:MAG: FxsA family protein [bacterium]